MLQLICAAAFFLGLHLLLSGSRLRDTLVARLGERGFRAGFSVLSVLGLLWLIHAYRQAPYLDTWGQLGGFKPVAAALMLLAFLLVVIGLATRNPAAAGGEGHLKFEGEVRGILRITRHPVLWGLTLWAAAHLIVNGDAAALVLFGSLLALCLAGTRSIDAKRHRAYGQDWEKFAAVTSSLPFLAILQGRNQWRPAEIAWWKPALAVVLYMAVMHSHLRLFGVSPLF